MSINRERQLEAAKELEKMTMVLKEYVRLLHMGQSDDLAYAILYHARHRLGAIVRNMGKVGVPSQRYLDAAVEIADSQTM